MKKLIYSMATTGLIALPASAAIIATDASPGNFGATGGVGVQFDATPIPAAASANISVTGLVAGTIYNIDSLTLVGNGATDTTPWYLGVYTGFTSSANMASVTGFQGVSNEAINWSTITTGSNISYTFSGITVTSNADLSDTTDLRYFILQSGTAAITDLPTIANNTTAIQRNSENGNITDSRLGIVQIPNGAGAGLRIDRAPVINVGFSVVPEPSSFALVLLSGMFAVTRRRR